MYKTKEEETFYTDLQGKEPGGEAIAVHPDSPIRVLMTEGQKVVTGEGEHQTEQMVLKRLLCQYPAVPKPCTPVCFAWLDRDRLVIDGGSNG